MKNTVRLPMALLVAAACGGDTTTGPPSPPDPPFTPTPTAIVLAPDSVVLGTNGDTARFTAVVRDQRSNTMTGVQLTWRSSDTTVARVDGTGLVRSVKPGQVTISAAVANLTAERRAVVKLQLNSACRLPTTFPPRPTAGALPLLTADRQAFRATPQPYSITETAAADIDGDGDQDIVFFNYNWIDQTPYTGTVLVYRNDGAAGFVDATAQILAGAHIIADNGTRPIVFEANGDRREDVFIGQGGFDASPFPGAFNLFLMTQPDGTLREVAATNLRTNDRAFTHSSAAADIDCDGDVDLFEGNINDFKGERVHLHVNNGAGVFTAEDQRLPASVAAIQQRYTSSAFCDVDRDGDEDLVLGGWQIGHSTNRLLLNDGFGLFSFAPGDPFPPPFFSSDNVTVEVRCSDIDVDGWPDLVLSSNQEYRQGHVAIWRNRGDGTFADVTQTALGGETWTGGWVMLTHLADLNGDGLPDLITSGTNSPMGRVFINRGEMRFTRLPSIPVTGNERLVPLRRGSSLTSDIIAVPWGSGGVPWLLRTH